jgi:hypothetical protein
MALYYPLCQRDGRSQFQQVPLFADVHRASSPHLHDLALRLVNMAAEKVLRLNLLDELAHGAAAGVKTLVYLVERGVDGRRMADHDQRL